MVDRADRPDPESVGEHERTHRLVVMIPPPSMALYDHQFLSATPSIPSASKDRDPGEHFVPREMVDHDWSEFMSRVECFTREDIDIIARVKAGNRSRSRHLGHLVEMERIVGDFHNYLARVCFEGPLRPTLAAPGR